MAITAVLVQATPDQIVYRLTNSTIGPGGAVTIPNDAGATPDLRTDTATVGGPIRRIVRAGVDGIGTVAAGAMTQGQSRDLLLGDNLSPIGNDLVERAICRLLPEVGAAAWGVDANVDGQGDPVVTVIAGAVADATCLLYIKARKSQAGEAEGAP